VIPFVFGIVISLDHEPEAQEGTTTVSPSEAALIALCIAELVQFAAGIVAARDAKVQEIFNEKPINK
jgi:hypothetical protein